MGDIENVSHNTHMNNNDNETHQNLQLDNNNNILK